MRCVTVDHNLDSGDGGGGSKMSHMRVGGHRAVVHLGEYEAGRIRQTKMLLCKSEMRREKDEK